MTKPLIPAFNLARGGAWGFISGYFLSNRFFGEFTEEDGKVSLKPGGATKMMCSPEEMSQEMKLLQMLPKIETYEIDGSGALILKSSDGSSISARRR